MALRAYCFDDLDRMLAAITIIHLHLVPLREPFGAREARKVKTREIIILIGSSAPRDLVIIVYACE